MGPIVGEKKPYASSDAVASPRDTGKRKTVRRKSDQRLCSWTNKARPSPVSSNRTVTSTVYSNVNITEGQNSWFLVIDAKFLGKLMAPWPVKRPQLLRDIRAASTRGTMNKMTTKMSVG